jgi:hypothetical protein
MDIRSINGVKSKILNLPQKLRFASSVRRGAAANRRLVAIATLPTCFETPSTAPRG